MNKINFMIVRGDAFATHFKTYAEIFYDTGIEVFNRSSFCEKIHQMVSLIDDDTEYFIITDKQGYDESILLKLAKEHLRKI